jgi:hypothetical protein
MKVQFKGVSEIARYSRSLLAWLGIAIGVHILT